MVDKATEDEWVRRVAQGEGFSATKKPDPSGIGYCVGYGHNLDTSGRGAKWVKQMTGKDINSGDKLTHADADKMCRADLKTTYAALDERFPWWRDLDPASQYVMVDMCYTMGADKLAKFKKMLSAVKEGNYDKASKEMLNSMYAKQTGQRARKNAELMRTGEWSDNDPKYNKDLYKRPTRIKGQDITKAQVREDTENAHKYSAKVEQQTKQQVAKAKVAQFHPATWTNSEPAKPKAQAKVAQFHPATWTNSEPAKPKAQAKVAQFHPATRTNSEPAKPKAQAKVANKVIHNPTTRAAASANVSNVSDKDVARMRSMLNNMNKANGKKKVDVDKTINSLTAQYGNEASKILTKAMMSPTSVAKKMDLRDKDGKLLNSSREIVQRLCEPKNTQEHDNALAMVAANRRGRDMS